jgi:K+-transporting ATPase KdpC subunit
MRRHLLASLVMLVGLTLVLGFAYPLLVTGIAALGFGQQANGSLVYHGGKLVGSSLLGQSFSAADGQPLPGYFQPRPSAAGSGYDATASGASNLGPSNPLLIGFVAGVNTVGLGSKPSKTNPFATKLDPTWRGYDHDHDGANASPSGPYWRTLGQLALLGTRRLGRPPWSGVPGARRASAAPAAELSLDPPIDLGRSSPLR